MISSGAAIWSATNGNRTLKRADRDSQARSRPMIAAELRDEPYAPVVQLLVIKNYGSTVARHVTVTFDPPLGDPAPEQMHQSLSPFLKQRYAKPISSLVPGQELDNIYFSGERDSISGWKNREPHPDQVRVTIAGRARRRALHRPLRSRCESDPQPDDGHCIIPASR